MGLFTKTPAERYGVDLIDRLPIGVSVYRLEDASDPGSFVVAYSNAASGRITGVDVEPEIGRRLVDVAPGVREAGLLDRYHAVVTTGRAEDLGTVEYGDDRIARGTYAVRAFPVGKDAVAIAFEDVSARSEVQALHEARDQLTAETARYRSLVDAAAAVVWTTTPEGALLTDLDQWEALTGQPAAEAAGDGWVAMVHEDDRAAAAEAWRAAVESASLYRTTYRLRQADGSYRLMEARGAPVRDADGHVVEWVGVNADVEAEAEAAAALAASEARFRTLFDALDDVVLVYPVGADGPGPFVTFNEAAVERYGYTRDELAAMTVHDLVAPSRVDVSAALDELRKERRATFESTHVTKGGERIEMSTAARLVEYDGRLCVVALCRDDSDRRRFRREIARSNRELEQAVAERTAQLEAFSEDLKILHGITTAEHDSPEARFAAYLRAGCEMFGLPVGILAATPVDAETGERLYRLEAVVSPDPALTPGLTVPISEAFCDAVVAEDRTVTYADAQAEAPGHPACATRGLRAFIGTPLTVAGELFGTLNFVSPEPRPDGFSDVERDLVEVMAQAVGRRIEADRTEAAEAGARERYRTIVETVEAGVLVVDRDLRVVTANPVARALLGLAAETPAGDGAPDGAPDGASERWPVLDADGVRVPPEGLPEREVLRTGRPVRGVIQGIVAPDGPVRWVRVNATPLDEDGDGAPDAVVVSFHDVTDFRDATRRAERSQDLFRAVLAATVNGVMAFRAVRDDDGAVVDFEWTFVSPLAGQIVGHDPDALLGRRMLDVFPGNREAGLFDAYVRVVTTGEPFETVVPYAHDGLETTFDVRAVPLTIADGFAVTFSEVVEAPVVTFEPAAAGPGA